MSYSSAAGGFLPACVIDNGIWDISFAAKLVDK